MTQRLAFAAAAGLVAFVVVLLGAVGLYLALAGPAVTAALAAPAAAPAVPQSASGTTTAPASGGGDTARNYPVSADEATNIALSNVPGATLVPPPRLVQGNGTSAYAVTLDRGLVYIDANRGPVLYNGAGGSRRRPRR